MNEYMKVAFLISAYTDPTQLGRLIHALNDRENHFFVHIDQKVNAKPFVDAVAESDRAFCTFIEERYWVQWGGFNQVRYQQALLRACVRSGIPFERVFILSALDYPLKSVAVIKAELEKDPEREYLLGLNLSDNAVSEKQKDRFRLYHFGRDVRVRSYKLKMICSGSLRLLMKVLPLRKKPYVDVRGLRWPIYMCSSYMCITFALAEYLLSEMDANKAVMDYFRYSFVPEELVIPTIVYNSAFAARTLGQLHEYKGLVTLSPVTHFWYGKQIKVLDEGDYDELMRSNKMFARKFRSGVSEKLMDRLSVI